jgi:catechol 2,3-dioxygenase-like lactoylglutathione lyase family enzyme
MTIETVHFRVPPKVAGLLSHTYVEALGMRALGALRFGYGAAELVFADDAPGPYVTDDADVYWKIGVTVPDLDAAVAKVRRAGVEVSSPWSLAGIGYLCHLRDPAGLQIELLQRRWEGHAQPSCGNPFGSAHLAHVSLRVATDHAAWSWWRAQRLFELDAMDVPGRAFSLSFLGPVAVTVPAGPLRARREWLWSRPETLIELQHRPGPVRASPGAGLTGLVIDGSWVGAETLARAAN